MKIRTLILASALLLGVAAFAQETNRDASGKRIYGPYETNKFWDNWFVSIGPGLNVGLDGLSSSAWGAGLGVDVEAGKWITPCSGIRFGWSGLKNGTPGTKFSAFPGNYNYNYIHADFLWNISNQFAGYKERRTVNVVPYTTSGLFLTDFTDEGNAGAKLSTGIGLGGGILIPIRCCDLVSVVPDFRVVGVLDGERTGTTTNALGGKRVSAALSAGVSVLFNLGKSNWTRKSTSEAALRAEAEASHNALLACKKAESEKVADLTSENEQLKALLENFVSSASDPSKIPAVAYFEMGKATLSDKELEHIDWFLTTGVSDMSKVKLVITGCADDFGGSRKRNEQLADMRAKYLIDLLTKKYGMKEENFTVLTKVVDGKSQLSRAVIITK